jgi:hypothetical protein
MLDAAYEDSRKNRYKFSPTKCEVVIFHAADVIRYGFNLGGTALRLSDYFRYLGVKVSGRVVLHYAENTTPERLQALEASIHGPHGGMNMVHASARLEALTARQFIFRHVLGVLGYCSSFMGHAPFAYGEDIQDEAARIALGFPPRKVQRNLDRVALCGDLGFPTVASRLAGDTLRLFHRIHCVPKSSQLWRVFNTYRRACAQQVDQRGNWCAWVRKVLADIGPRVLGSLCSPGRVPYSATAARRSASSKLCCTLHGEASWAEALSEAGLHTRGRRSCLKALVTTV